MNNDDSIRSNNIEDIEIEKLNDREIEAYLEVIKDDTPDLWDRISEGYDKELGIRNKKSERKLIKKAILALAAALLVVLIAIPILENSGLTGRRNSDDISNKKNQNTPSDETDYSEITGSEEKLDFNSEEKPDSNSEVNQDDAACDGLSEQTVIAIGSPCDDDNTQMEPSQTVSDDMTFDNSVEEVILIDLENVSSVECALNNESTAIAEDQKAEFVELFNTLGLSKSPNQPDETEPDGLYYVRLKDDSFYEIKLVKAGKVYINDVLYYADEKVIEQLINFAE